MTSHRMVPMHVGGPVADLDAAIAHYRVLGADPWVVTDTIAFDTYDGERNAVVETTMRVAFGRLGSGLAVELIEPGSLETDTPQTRLLRTTPGLSHVGYWCADVAGTARTLRSEGWRLLTASTAGPNDWREVVHRHGEDGLIGQLRTCYLGVPVGGIVELVDEALFEDGLPELLGPKATVVLPPPWPR